MNAQRRIHLEQQLAASEATLADRLRFLLPDSAKPGSRLFSSGALPHLSGLVYFVPPVRGELCVLASECIRLRKKLSMPLEGSMAHIFLAACSEASDADVAQRHLANLLLVNVPLAQPQSNPSLERP
jgi:hypothetical protein